MCLGNISKDFKANNMKKKGMHGYIYECSVDYNIINIHKYLMKKHDIKKYLEFLKNVYCVIL